MKMSLLLNSVSVSVITNGSRVLILLHNLFQSFISAQLRLINSLLVRGQIVDVFDTLGQMKRLPFTDVISIDEFYWNRKSKTKYACAIIDFDTGKIIDCVSL